MPAWLMSRRKAFRASIILVPHCSHTNNVMQSAADVYAR